MEWGIRILLYSNMSSVLRIRIDRLQFKDFIFLSNIILD